MNLSIFSDENAKLLTLEPLKDDEVVAHKSTFINELKISDFKQVLLKNNIQSEFSNGALWCANSTIAVRRVRYNIFQFIQMKKRLTK